MPPTVLLAAGLIETPLLESDHSELAAAALYIPVAGAVGMRRRAPIAAAAGLSVASLVSGYAGGISGSVTLWLAFTVAYYSLGRHVAPERRPLAVALVVAVSAAFIPASDGKLENFLAACGVSIVIPFLAGLLHQRHLHARDLIEAAERRAGEHAEAVRRAAEDERARLARELHDIVSHTVGTIAVQAEAGDALIDRDPVAARASVKAIQQSARGAMVELRRLLSVLRSDDPEALRAPQPGLAALPGLVERLGAAGLHVVVRLVGQVQPLPPAIDLSSYRVIQEGLTNALVHSGAREASVTISFTEDQVAIVVADAGHGTPAPFGTGLTGMRERVQLLNGAFDARATDPGWRLSVTLPLEERP